MRNCPCETSVVGELAHGGGLLGEELRKRGWTLTRAVVWDGYSEGIYRENISIKLLGLRRKALAVSRGVE